MKQSLELRLGQTLNMTPQLQQAIKLLQLSAIDLQSEIQQALDENPLLEEPDADQNFDNGAESEPVSARETATDIEDSDGMSGEETTLPADENTVTPDADSDISEWSEQFESHITGVSADTGTFEFEDRSSSPTTLGDYLLWQMCTVPFSDTDRKIAVCLIDAIDEDGYLKVSINDIVDTLARESVIVEKSEVEATLHQIQNFDPPGVGARDLRECLLIQIRQHDQTLDVTRYAARILDEYFELLSNRSIAQIKRAMRLSENSLNEAVRLIQSLHPRPGNAVTPAQARYIVPDIIVKKTKGEWRAEINREAIPKLRINQAYKSMLGPHRGSEENKYIQNNLQNARFFIRSLDQRNETLLNVAEKIIERQRNFFEQGEQAMQPMVLHDIAKALELHESTISRATTQKYMLTPRGIFELKYFFSSAVTTASGGTCSSTVIRTKIRQFVEGEKPTKPISDSKIAKLLGQQGINVARRTVTKYRENMNIPASSQRKTIA